MLDTARFWSKVQTGTFSECWPWLGAKHPKGYGMFCLTKNPPKTVRAHRLAFELSVGRKISAGMCVLHSCDNPPCCNPAHLREGSPKDNAIDRVQSGHADNPRRKFTKEQIVEIRKEYSEGCTHGDLYKKYNCSAASMSFILNGRLYKNC